jgi:hypothetical protein
MKKLFQIVWKEIEFAGLVNSQKWGGLHVTVYYVDKDWDNIKQVLKFVYFFQSCTAARVEVWME